MTSLPLFPPAEHAPTAQREWGTGAPKTKVPLWSPKPPTWHQSGQPTTQFYELTKLRKSNVRWNDQLLPKPQEADISQKMIGLPFPADHPYASHISRFAIFPSFATLAEEPKRGVAARASLPLSAETPAAAYDVQVVHKIKGFGDRHEVQAAPPDSLKRGLTWHEGFDHKVKVFNDRQPFYPVPAKAVAANMTPRQGELAVTEKTAECTRNIERQQWKTNYELDYTGLGPSNPLYIDNYDDKTHRRHVTGVEDDSLRPHFTSTFDPARPQDGRLAQLIAPSGPPLTKRGAAVDEGAKHDRKPTLTEREEHRLLHGKTYVSLPEVGPESRHTSEQWHTWSQTQAADPQFERLAQLQQQAAEASRELVDRRPAEGSTAEGRVTYPAVLKQQQADDIQQLEARNRWKVLESQKPSHDIAELGRKMQMAATREKPSVFYGHEGLYNEERAGLYKTSYDPGRLQLAFETPMAARFDTSTSHIESLSYPTALNFEIDAALSGSKTFPANVPMFSERPSPSDVVGPFNRDMALQALHLQPTSKSSRPRVQEGVVVLTRSEHGAAYNAEKFLQQYELPPNVRSEPLSLMSSENQNLANVRLNSLRRSAPPRLSTDAIENSGKLPPAPSERNWMQMTREVSEGVKNSLSSSNNQLDRRWTADHSPQNAGNAPDSLAISNGSSREVAAQFDLGYKNDDAFAWVPGCGVPRPQSKLLQLQDTFTKSAAHLRLHASIDPDGKPPSLIKNIHTGRKHEFGLNAQVLRGAAEVH